MPPPEETSSPLIKELENKLQKRREKNSTSDEHTTEAKENEVIPQQAKQSEQTIPEQIPPKPTRSQSEKKSAPIAAEKKDAESDALESQVEKLRSEIAQLRTENIKLREKASENDKLKKAQKEKLELEEKVKSLEDVNQQIQAREKNMSSEYAELKKKVAKEEDRMNDEVQERLGIALKERQNILASFEELSQLCCKLAPRLDSIESAKEKQKTPDDVLPRVETLGESQKMVSKDVTTLRHHLDELELRIIRLEVDKDNMEDSNGDKFAALEDMKKENTALMAKIKKLEVELEVKKSNLLRVENEKSLMSSQLSVLMTEVENLKRKMDELSIAHGEKEAELEISVRKHSTLNEEIKVQGIKLQTMASLVKEKEEACNKAEKKMREAKKLNEELMKRYAILDNVGNLYKAPVNNALLIIHCKVTYFRVRNKTRKMRFFFKCSLFNYRLHEQEKKSPAKMNGAASPAAPLADDMDRMRKISERFAVELYGGLWREAFEKLTTVFKREEKKSLQILMDFCTVIFIRPNIRCQFSKNISNFPKASVDSVKQHCYLYCFRRRTFIADGRPGNSWTPCTLY